LQKVKAWLRTVARKFSVGGLWVCAGGLDTAKINKNSTDLHCFMFQSGGLGTSFGGISPQKPSRGDGTGVPSIDNVR